MKGVGPGTVLGGRYAVGIRLAEDRGVERWEAADTTLGRSVAVLVIATDDHRAPAFVDAARRAASVSHPVLSRILDVGQDREVAYVVEEEPAEGRTLTQIVAEGGVPGAEVRRITGEVASALDAARARGMHHLDLTPDDVLRTTDGEIRLRGLETAAVRAGQDGVDADEAARRDAVGVVALAYAGLTGLWPLGAGGDGLGHAPRVPTGVASPSEIASGVPRDLDAICRLTLNDDQGPTSPGDYARQVAPWPSRQVVGKPAVPVAPADAIRRPTPQLVGPDGVVDEPEGAADPGTGDATGTAAAQTAPMPAVPAPGSADAPGGVGAADDGPADDGPADEDPADRGPGYDDRADDEDAADDDAVDGEPSVEEEDEPYRPASALRDAPPPAPTRGDPPAWLVGPGWDAFSGTDPSDRNGTADGDVESGDGDSGRGRPAAAAANGAAATNGAVPRSAAGAGSRGPGERSARPTGDGPTRELARVGPREVAPRDDGSPGRAVGAAGTSGAVGGALAEASQRAGAAGTALVGVMGVVGTRVSGAARRAVDRMSELSPDTVREPAEVAAPARREDPDYDPYEDDEDLAPLVPAERLSRDDSRLALGIVAAFLALALVIGIIGVRQIGSETDIAGFDSSSTPGASPTASPSASGSEEGAGGEGGGTPAPEPLAILKVSAYDPEGDGAENNSLTGKTFDGDTSDGWYSENYRTDEFGGLKQGVGLIVDLGPNKKPQEVQLTIPHQVDLEVSINSEPSLEGATKIGEETEVEGQVDVAVPEDVTGQYVILWYTRLYPDSDGKRRAWLNEVVVTG